MKEKRKKERRRRGGTRKEVELRKKKKKKSFIGNFIPVKTFPGHWKSNFVHSPSDTRVILQPANLFQKQTLCM